MTDTVTERPSVAGPGPRVLRALIIAVVMGDFTNPELRSNELESSEVHEQ